MWVGRARDFGVMGKIHRKAQKFTLICSVRSCTLLVLTQKLKYCELNGIVCLKTFLNRRH